MGAIIFLIVMGSVFLPMLTSWWEDRETRQKYRQENKTYRDGETQTFLVVILGISFLLILLIAMGG